MRKPLDACNEIKYTSESEHEVESDSIPAYSLWPGFAFGPILVYGNTLLTYTGKMIKSVGYRRPRHPL